MIYSEDKNYWILMVWFCEIVNCIVVTLCSQIEVQTKARCIIVKGRTRIILQETSSPNYTFSKQLGSSNTFQRLIEFFLSIIWVPRLSQPIFLLIAIYQSYEFLLWMSDICQCLDHKACDEQCESLWEQYKVERGDLTFLQTICTVWEKVLRDNNPSKPIFIIDPIG